MSHSRARTSTTRGVNDSVVRNAHRERHRDLDPQGLLTPAIVRQFIESATCPYCGAGPFTTLAGHTNRAHGVDRHDLRAAAELSGRQSIASAEYAERCSERGKRNGFGSGVDAASAARKARANGQGEMTAAGLARQRENIARVTASRTSEDYRKAREKAWRTMLREGTAAEKVASLHKAKSGRTPAEVAAVVTEVRERGLSVAEIAEQYGYSFSGARNIFARANQA